MRTLTKNPTRFWSYTKGRKQENDGVSSLIDKDGFLQSDSQKKSDILNNQFQSVYTRKYTSNLQDKGSSPHPTMKNITVIKHQVSSNYFNTLESVDGAKYLGVTLSEDLSWTPRVDNTAAKASRTLGFLRRSMSHCTDKVRERTYNALVLPVLNYTAAAWDPYLSRDINSLDQVQRRGVRYRYICNNYWDRTPGCVTKMIQDLGWQSLQEKREDHSTNYTEPKF